MRFVCDSCRAQYMISDEKVGPKGVKVRCKKCGYVILVKKADANGFAGESRAGEASRGGGKHAAPPPAAPVPLSNDPDDALATQVLQNPLTGPSATLPTGDDSMTAPGINEEKTSQMPAQGAGLLDASEDEIGAVFDQVLNSGAHSIPKGAKGEEKTELDMPAKLGGEQDDRLSTRVIDADVVKKLAEETGNGAAEAKNGNGHAPSKEVPKTDWFVAIDDKQTGPLTLDKIKEHWERGEIGPDSLCWRAGFSDWIPVSEVADLAAELAPRPAKPVMVAPVTVGGGMPGGAVVSVPVESAFSAGGVMKSVRSEVQVPLAAAAPEETGSWRPSAASALASLVKEEMEALAKPPPKGVEPSDVPEVSTGGLLSDLPEASVVAPKAAKGMNGHSNPAAAVVPAPGEMTAAHGPKNPYIANPGATYSSPAVTQYRPPSDNKTAIIAIIALSVVAVLGIAAFVIVNVMKPQPQPVVQNALPPPSQPIAQNNLPPAQPNPNAQPNGVAQPPPAQPNANTAAQNPPPGQPAPNGTVAQPPPGQPNPNTQAANTQPVKPTAPRPIGAKPTGGDKVDKPVAVAEKPAKEDKPSKVESPKGGDDEFAAAFGGGDSKKKETKTESKPAEESSGSPKKSSVYIPPAPGQGGNIPETLGQSDIMEVVKGNIGPIKKCVDEQKAKEPGTSGKLVMKWTVLTSGKTAKVEVVSEEFKSTYLAGCVGGLIKGWTFPKHKTQGDPIVFPFKF